MYWLRTLGLSQQMVAVDDAVSPSKLPLPHADLRRKDIVLGKS